MHDKNVLLSPVSCKPIGPIGMLVLSIKHVFKKRPNNLVDHAERELRVAGLFDKDSDYNGMLGKVVLDLVKTFAKQGHSGFSAGLTLYLFNELGKYKTLTPVTDIKDEWMEVCDERTNNKAVWQSKRDPALFSNDGGKTYYSVDDKKRKLKKSVSYAAEVKKRESKKDE